MIIIFLIIILFILEVCTTGEPFTSLLLGVSLIMFVMFPVGLSHRTIVVERQNLEAISLDSQTKISGSGVYVLGTGTSSVSSYDVDKYKYYVEDAVKGYELKSAEPSYSYIKMDILEDEQPYVETKVLKCENGQKVFPLSLWGFNCIGSDTDIEYTFHIPKGSLKNEYEIGLREL